MHEPSRPGPAAGPPGPRLGLPIFDAHLHIVDPRFPPIPNRGYLPPPFSVGDYRAAVAGLGGGLGVVGGALVSGSFQGLDQSDLEAALAELGPGFVGVAQVAPAIADTEVVRLDRLGVRAVRFNLYRGMAEDPAQIERLARRVHDLAGWHAEFYLDAAAIPDLESLLKGLPRISIDHLGLTRRGLTPLLRLVECGARVKASGFSRLDFPASEAIAAVAAVDPGALLFGTDLPSTRAPRPFGPADIGVLAEALGEREALALVLYDNALSLYRPGPRA